MKTPSTDRIRNVALVGHNGSGKTTLAEALLMRAGVLPRAGTVEDGSTVCDTEPEEVKRTMSLSLALAPFEWECEDDGQTYKINLIDTPGYADFGGDVDAALAVADLAVIVVSAVDGVEVGTEQAWAKCAARDLPRLVFVNKEDKPRADFHRVLDQLRTMFGTGFAPLELPLGEEERFHGIADVLSQQGFEYEPDGRHHVGDLPNDVADEEYRLHDELVEEIVAGDDEQLERYLSGEVPTTAELEKTLAHEVLDRSEFPVLVGSATTGIGVDRLADFICELGPSPADRPVTVHRRPRRRRRRVGGGRRRVGQAAGLRVQDGGRPVRRAGVALQGAVGDHRRRRPAGQHGQRHRGAHARPLPPAGQGAPQRRPGRRRRHRRRRQAGRHRHRLDAGAEGRAGAGPDGARRRSRTSASRSSR